MTGKSSSQAKCICGTSASICLFVFSLLKKSNPNSPIATTLESPWAAFFIMDLELHSHLLASRGCKPTE